MPPLSSERFPISTNSHDQLEMLFDIPTTGEYRVLEDSNNPELRTEYIGYTEKLIADLIRQNIEEVVYLDKSARPVAWMVNELWSTLGTDADGNVLPKPRTHFANIDREQWGPIVGRSEDKTGRINVDLVPEGTIKSLRSTFSPKGELSQDSYFTGKKLMIVDEMMTSGDTLTIASGLFERAFPDAEEVKTGYWMPTVTRQRSGSIRVGTLPPVWYRDNHVQGRLVGDRSFKVSDKSDSRAQRDGRYFLSSRFDEIDKEGLRLKQEVKALARDVKNGLIPVLPPADYEDFSPAQQEAFMHRVNGLSEKEYVELKKEAVRTKTSFTKLFVKYKQDRAIAEIG